MTVASYTSDLSDIFLWENDTNVTDFGGGGQASSVGIEYTVEGVNAVAKPISNSERGFLHDDVTNFTIGADDHIFSWCLCSIPGLMDTRDNRGLVLCVGDDTSNFVKFHLQGGDTLPFGGIQPYAVRFDNTSLANRRTLVGSPGTTPSQIGVGSNITAVARFDNTAIDASRIGTGYDILNGNGADPEANFAGIAADDVSTAEGVFVTTDGGFRLQGKLRIGSAATACEFLDSNTSILIVDSIHSLTDFTEIIIEHASSILTLDNVTFTALGTNNRGRLEMITSAATLALTGVGFIDFGATVLGTGATMTGCRWIGADIITQNGALITGCAVSVTTALHAILSDDPGDLVDNTFTSDGDSHAVRCDTIGTYDWEGNFDTGYTGTRGTNLVAATGSTNAAFYNNSGGLITLNVTGGGQSPSVRNGAGATTQVNASVTVSVAGLTWGTPVKLIARETLGSVTDGDTLSEGFADSTGVFTYSHNDQGSLDLSVVARNQGVAVAAIAEDNPAFVDETDEAHSNTTADMTLLPAVPDVDDAYYFGHNEQFNSLKLSISTALAHSVAPDIVFEYFNGTIWVAVAGLVDNTNALETTGENTISWTMPGNWATTTINTQGPLFYFRLRVSAVGTITTAPVGRRASLDVTRYFPYDEIRTIVSGVGLSDNATWTEDKISTY